MQTVNIISAIIELKKLDKYYEKTEPLTIGDMHRILKAMLTPVEEEKDECHHEYFGGLEDAPTKMCLQCEAVFSKAYIPTHAVQPQLKPGHVPEECICFKGSHNPNRRDNCPVHGQHKQFSGTMREAYDQGRRAQREELREKFEKASQVQTKEYYIDYVRRELFGEKEPS